MDLKKHNIITDRLNLLPISSSDTEYMYSNSIDPEISRFMSWSPHKTIDETGALIERLIQEMQQDKSYTWSIYKENVFCGIISLIAILRKHRSLIYNRAELAYWLSTRQQGKGYMTEAANAVLKYAFNEMGIHRVTVGHAQENKASEALINRLGFRYIGTEHEAFMKNGKWINHRLYELLEQDLHKPERP